MNFQGTIGAHAQSKERAFLQLLQAACNGNAHIDNRLGVVTVLCIENGVFRRIFKNSFRLVKVLQWTRRVLSSYRRGKGVDFRNCIAEAGKIL